MVSLADQHNTLLPQPAQFGLTMSASGVVVALRDFSDLLLILVVIDLPESPLYALLLLPSVCFEVSYPLLKICI